MVKPFGHVAQFHELLKVCHGRVTTTTVAVAYERRAINRSQNEVLATNLNVALGIASVLNEFRRSGFAQFTSKAAGNTNAFALNVCACCFPQFERFWVIDKVYANFSENRFGVFLDDFQCLVVQNFEVRNVAFDVFCRFDADGRPFRTTGSTATPTSTTTTSLCNIRHIYPSGRCLTFNTAPKTHEVRILRPIGGKSDISLSTIRLRFSGRGPIPQA